MFNSREASNASNQLLNCMLAVCASIFLSAPACGAVIYNASADLLANELPDGSNANPNGVWRYGTAGSVGGARHD